MLRTFFATLRQQWMGGLALFFVLTGGSAYALSGTNTVFSDDIVNDEVKNQDLAANSVGTGKVADAHLTGIDIANNSLKGADVDEGSLDIGDAARAYAFVDDGSCTGTPGTCTPEQSKGISSVTREDPGTYCVTAPGIDSAVTPAAVTVDWANTGGRPGNTSAMTYEFGSSCGPSGFFVLTERQPVIDSDPGAGTISASGPAVLDNDVAFTIVIP